MKKLLIISATPFSNFDLSEEIKVYLEKKPNLSCKIISLEDLNLPLFTPSLEIQIKKKNNFPKEITEIKSMLVSSDATILNVPSSSSVFVLLSNLKEEASDSFDCSAFLFCTTFSRALTLDSSLLPFSEIAGPIVLSVAQPEISIHNKKRPKVNL